MVQRTVLHGRTMAYVEAGEGSVLLLIHGIAGDWESWRAVIEPLAAEHRVIAPDLPGHGASQQAPGDYSVGGLAASLRDLMMALGHDRATVVGHSLGGGIAMQFAYQFPELVERLVLISSGGLGSEVSPLLRSAALPGAGPFIAATAALGQKAGASISRGLSTIGVRPSIDLTEIARGYASLADRRRRRAFLATLRFGVGTRGQRVAATNRLYLAEALPVMFAWGACDPIIPVRHAQNAHRTIPGSRLEIFEGTGHFPQLEDPERLTAVFNSFMAETDPRASSWRNGGCGSGRRLLTLDQGRSRCRSLQGPSHDVCV